MTAAIAFALANWKLILGGIVAAALSIALFTTRATLHDRTTERDLAVANLATEQMAHAVTRSSLNSCQSIVDADNAQSEARAKAYADSAKEDTANNTANDKREASTAPARAALSAIAKAGGGSGPCKVPDAVSANLEGL